MTARLAALLLLVVVAGCAHAQSAQDTALGAVELYQGRVLAVGIAAGRDGADQPQKLWLAEERGVHELGPEGAVQVWKPPRFTRILRLQAADLDGDGADEWVVLIDQGRMRSLIVGVGPEGRTTLGRPWNGWLRPVQRADGSWELVGQRSGGERSFRGPNKRVTLQADGSLLEGERLDLPPNLAVYDWFEVPEPPSEEGEEPRLRLFSVEESGKLVERDPRSPRAITWRGDERVAGRIVEATRVSQSMLGDEEELVVRLLPPVAAADADGRPGVLLVGGTQTPVAVLRGLRIFQGGDVRLLVPDDRGLREVRRTPLVGRAVVAATTWEIEPGRTVWAAAVWMKVAGGFERPESRVFLFDPATGDLVQGR